MHIIEKRLGKKRVENEHGCVRQMAPWVASDSRLTVKEKRKGNESKDAKLVKKAGLGKAKITKRKRINCFPISQQKRHKSES